MLELSFTIGLLIVAYLWGNQVEKNHLKSLTEREKTMLTLPIISYDKNDDLGPVRETRMVSGSIVIGADYFKSTLGKFINFFGGNIAVLESVLLRARRESLLRLLHQAGNADYVANVRYETTMISDAMKGQLPQVEIFAYGTAIYLEK